MIFNCESRFERYDEILQYLNEEDGELKVYNIEDENTFDDTV